LSPAEKLGEFFGVYAPAGRLSAVTGPLITAILLTAFGGLGSTGYRLAVAFLALIVVLALILLLRVPDVRAGYRRVPKNNRLVMRGWMVKELERRDDHLPTNMAV
jgi:UMF1 family MFS transporter